MLNVVMTSYLTSMTRGTLLNMLYEYVVFRAVNEKA